MKGENHVSHKFSFLVFEVVTQISQASIIRFEQTQLIRKAVLFSNIILKFHIYIVSRFRDLNPNLNPTFFASAILAFCLLRKWEKHACDEKSDGLTIAFFESKTEIFVKNDSK